MTATINTTTPTPTPTATATATATANTTTTTTTATATTTTTTTAAAAAAAAAASATTTTTDTAAATDQHYVARMDFLVLFVVRVLFSSTRYVYISLLFRADTFQQPTSAAMLQCYRVGGWWGPRFIAPPTSCHHT